jgi:hypothetical protein
VISKACSARLVAAFAAFGLGTLGGWSGLASAANAPTPGQLRQIGSSSKAAHAQPKGGLRGTASTSPLIVISFANNKAVVLGGSAVGKARDVHAANIPISAAQCSVNFTTRKRRATNAKSVSVRWFAGIGCTRSMFLFGRAFLAESASKFDGSGNFYSGTLKTASSGQASTTIPKPNPSLYVWSATNVFFQERPSRGVIAILPSPGQALDSATTCSIAKSPKYGFGVHCDLYTARF